MFATLCMLVGFAAGALLDKIIFCLIVWFLIQRIGKGIANLKAAVKAEADDVVRRARRAAWEFRQRYRHVIGPTVVIRPWG